MPMIVARARVAAMVLANGLPLAVLAVVAAQAQDGRQVPSQPTLQSVQPAGEPPATESVPPAGRPGGFLEALGRFIGQSKEAIDSQIKNTQETLGTIGTQATGVAKDATNAAKDAASNVIALPGTRIVTGRQLCPLATNGAPDCQQGAAALCRDKGYQGGRLLDIQTSQRCSARSWLQKGGPKEGDCRTENFVTRAVCQ